LEILLFIRLSDKILTIKLNIKLSNGIMKNMFFKMCYLLKYKKKYYMWQKSQLIN